MKNAFPKHPLRARFGAQKEIVCEFLPPTRTSSRVLILCTGMPSYPGGAGKAIRAFAEKGYWVFVPRYAGSWESDGSFLDHEPSEDVRAVIDGLAEPITDLMTGATFRVEHPEVFILGASFGGAAALLASRDPRVVKVAALSPVVDWTKQEGTNEPLDERTEKLILAAWGNGYRLSADPFGKLAAGDFYNPVRKAGEMQGKKILIIHTKDDPTVPFAPAEAFAKEVGAKFVALRTGGHFGVSSALEWRLWWRINMFFKAK